MAGGESELGIVVGGAAIANGAVTSYRRELARIDAALAEAARTSEAERDVEQTTAALYLAYQRASIGGTLDEFDPVERAIDKALTRFGPWPDICLLKANLDHKFHRLAAVRRDLAMAAGLAETRAGRLLLADIGLQEGRYADSRRGYEAAIEEEPAWDALARLAHWHSKWGETAEAERLFVEAEDEITAKDMRSFAWVELQRGLLDLRHGRHAEAAEHYDRARAAYTGYWLIDDHIAELAAADGRIEEAIELYRSVVERAPRPELLQVVGELYGVLGDQAESELWNARALAGYLEATRRGGVHYYHHLVDLLCDMGGSVDAVAWAQQDFELRPCYSTQAALAVALWKQGDAARAAAEVDAALACGVRDAHLFAQAAEIHATAGNRTRADELSAAALAINPRYQSFHVHR